MHASLKMSRALFDLKPQTLASSGSDCKGNSAFATHAKNAVFLCELKTSFFAHAIAMCSVRQAGVVCDWLFEISLGFFDKKGLSQQGNRNILGK
jgi:hypothetical protein